MTKISVILPVYNAETFILEAVNSILNQNFKDFELILIDDASFDNTASILSGISDSRIRLFHHDQNQGLVASLNEGLHIACGDFIARMDHDDVALPERFARQVAFLEQNPMVDVVGTGYRLIDQDGNFGHSYRPPATSEEINWAMCFLCPLAHPTIMARREILLAHGGYDKAATFAEDYDLWERLSRKVKIANLPETLLLLRKHHRNMSKFCLNDNLRMSINIATRHIDFLLGQEIDSKIVSCLYTQGLSHPEYMKEAQQLIIRLSKTCCNHGSVINRVIRRDAAKRIALMGLKTGRLDWIFISVIEALNINPSVIITLLFDLVQRARKQGNLVLLG